MSVSSAGIEAVRVRVWDWVGMLEVWVRVWVKVRVRVLVRVRVRVWVRVRIGDGVRGFWLGCCFVIVV